MPRKSETVVAGPVEAPAPVVEVMDATAEPVGVHHKRFTVRTVTAASDSGKGYLVFDTQDQRIADGPFRDREDADARAKKREIRG